MKICTYITGSLLALISPCIHAMDDLHSIEATYFECVLNDNHKNQLFNADIDHREFEKRVHRAMDDDSQIKVVVLRNIVSTTKRGDELISSTHDSMSVRLGFRIDTPDDSDGEYRDTDENLIKINALHWDIMRNGSMCFFRETDDQCFNLGIDKSILFEDLRLNENKDAVLRAVIIRIVKY